MKNYNDDKKISECNFCRKSYTSDRKARKYCSSSCAASANNSIVPKRTFEGVCCDCGLKISSSLVRCENCRNVSDISYGEFVLKYKNPRSLISDRARRKAKNLKDSCAYCGYDKHVDVCHIKEVSSFADSAMVDSEINNIENLIKLCKNHHWELDKGLLSIDKIKH